MRILNEQDQELTEAGLDLDHGYVLEEVIIRPGAAPVDNETKWAYTDEDYETIRRYIRIPDGELVRRRIEELKRKLRETDYYVLKIMEGVSTLGDYAEMLASRKAWRAEINELEQEALM